MAKKSVKPQNFNDIDIPKWLIDVYAMPINIIAANFCGMHVK